MACSEQAGSHPYCSLRRTECRGIPSASMLDAAEVVIKACGFAAAAEPSGVHDLQGTAIKGQGVTVASLIFAEHAEIVERTCQVEIARAEEAFGQSNGEAPVAIALCVATERPTNATQMSSDFHAQAADVRMAKARISLQHRVGSLVATPCLGPMVGHFQSAAQFE